MNFRKQIMMYNQKHQLIKDGDLLLVACSGGADSIALLVFLSQQKDFLGIGIGCIHANHGLRGEESEEDERFVEMACHNLDIPFYSKNLSIQEILQNEKGNLQDICRRERYCFFEQVMKEYGYNKLAVAHHADDQVESVFMGLTRGTRTNGMYSKRHFGTGELIRPLLSVTRKQIENYLNKENFTYREDSSNKKDTYTRNRFRHSIVPLVREENPNVATAITYWTQNQQKDEQLLEKLAVKEYEKIIISSSLRSISIDIQLFQDIEVALQKRVILLLLNYIYPNKSLWLSHSLIDQIYTQCLKRDGSGEIHLPKGRKVLRHYSTMLFSFESIESSLSKETILVAGEWTSVNSLRIILCNRDDMFCFDDGWYVTLEPSELPIRIRGRQRDDRLLIKGMKESKRLSRLMIDEKVPRHSREAIQLLETQQGDIIGVPGVRLGSRFTKEPHTGWTHKFRIEKESY